MDAMTIHRAIRRADIDPQLATEGWCGPVARALRNVLHGQLVVVRDTDGRPRHAAVLVDGDLFDGTGQTGVTELVTRFVDPFCSCDSAADRPSQQVSDDQTISDCAYLQRTASLSEFRTETGLQRDVEQRVAAALEDLGH